MIFHTNVGQENLLALREIANQQRDLGPQDFQSRVLKQTHDEEFTKIFVLEAKF